MPGSKSLFHNGWRCSYDDIIHGAQSGTSHGGVLDALHGTGLGRIRDPDRIVEAASRAPFSLICLPRR